MPRPGSTALTAPVPALDPVLAAVEAHHPGATRPNTAHVTFLYPFVPMPALDSATTDWLSALAARQAPITLEFHEVSVEPGFVYLSSPLLAPLTDEIRSHWPELVPYLSRFGPNPVAHISLAIDITDQSDALAIATVAAANLPERASIDHLWLVGHDDTDWHTLGRFPFTA
jgi:hypothetical protein